MPAVALQGRHDIGGALADDAGDRAGAGREFEHATVADCDVQALGDGTREHAPERPAPVGRRPVQDVHLATAPADEPASAAGSAGDDVQLVRIDPADGGHRARHRHGVEAAQLRCGAQMPQRRRAVPRHGHQHTVVRGDGSDGQANGQASGPGDADGVDTVVVGLDVPGETCQLVLIDRIPFPRPDDPLMSARQRAADQAGGNGFMQVAATHAALLLAQGAGRLIWTTTDRGVVAVLDPRLVTARYGGFLKASLPPMWVTTDPDVVRQARKQFGEDQNGAQLERHFGGPPYGASVESLQVVLAGAVRGGLLQVVSQAAKITSATDQRLEQVFGNLPKFRAASFQPADDSGPSLAVRGDVSEWLAAITGEHLGLDVRELADAGRRAFEPLSQPCIEARSRLSGAGLTVPEGVNTMYELRP